MPRGSKPGERRGGRQMGSRNRRTIELEQATAAAAAKVEAVIPGAFHGDPVEYLMTVYKDPSVAEATRIDAAKAAAPYIRPALARQEITMDADVTQRVISAEPMTLADWEDRYGLGAKASRVEPANGATRPNGDGANGHGPANGNGGSSGHD